MNAKAVPNTAKEFGTDTLARKTHSTARLTVSVRRSAQGDRVGSEPPHSYLFGHPEERSDEGSLKINIRASKITLLRQRPQFAVRLLRKE